MDDIVHFDHIQGASIYVATLGAIGTGISYIESTHSLLAGCIAGACSIATLLIVGALVRYGNTARRAMS